MTAPSNYLQGIPFLTGTAPTITAVTSQLQSLRVDFAPPANAYPTPTTFYYSVDGGATFTLASETAPPITIAGLTEAVQANVCLLAQNDAGNTEVSTTVLATPWIVGSAPTVAAVTSGVNSLVVSFTDGSGGYPAPNTYYYSVSGEGGPFVQATGVSSGLYSTKAFTVGNLMVNAVSHITMFAENDAGNTAVSNTVAGRPWVVGTAVQLTDVQSQLQRLVVQFIDSSNGYPSPSRYYYSLGDGVYRVATDVSGNVLTIGNLFTATNYTVTVIAENEAGNTSASNTLNATPWIVGSAPVIANVVSQSHSLRVYFSDGSGGYPAITNYFYSLETGANTWYAAPAITAPPSFVITGLDYPTPYAVSLVAQNLAGNTAPSNTVSATPYIVGDPPVINSVVSGYQSLSIYFTPVNNGYPVLPDRYYYSLDFGATYEEANGVSSPITITGLTSSNAVTVYLVSSNAAGNTQPAVSDPNTPNVIGQPPVITDVSSIVNGLSVSFNAPVGGFPAPSSYSCSIDGGAFTDLGNVGSPIQIGNLTIAKPYSVRLKATNAAGVTDPSDPPGTGTPFVKWGAPHVDNIISQYNGFDVQFSDATATQPGNPAPDTYYYTLDGGNTFTEQASVTTGGNVTYLPIRGLTVAGTYHIQLQTHNIAGNSDLSFPPAVGYPYVIGSAPTVYDVSSAVASVKINFAPGTGGYPNASSYLYSLDDGNTFEQTLTTQSPIVVGELTEPNRIYSIRLKAVSLAGVSPVSGPTAATGRPWLVGTAPTITHITSGYHSLTIHVTEGINGYPDPSTYYYSLDTMDMQGNATTFYDAGQTGNTISLYGLNTPTRYYLSVKASNAAGNTAVSNTVSGEPWIIGSAPTIERVDSSFQSVVVSFTASTGGYPEPTTYYYSLFGASGPWLDANTVTSPLTISPLTTATVYSIALKAQYAAGNTAVSTSVSGEPWIVGSSPQLTQIDSSFERLVVYFTAGTGGFPDPPTYYYSLQGTAGPFVDSGYTSSPLEIGNLTTATTYAVSILGRNAAGDTPPSNVLPGTPWVIGTAPTIDGIRSQKNSVVVEFTPGTGGYPDPPVYYYSLQGSVGPFVDSGFTGSPLVIGNLLVAGTYDIAIRGRNAAGNTVPSNVVPGNPWIVGTAPTITSVNSQTTSLQVEFQAGTGGYPDPPTYYYSLNGEAGPFVESSSTSSPIIIGNLLTATVYSIALLASNAAGNTLVSNTVSGEPWVVGTAPTILNVVGASGEITVSFTLSANGYPPATYDYSLDGGNTFVSTAQSTSPLTITGFRFPTVCNVQLRAVNNAGNVLSTNTVRGEPLIVGSTPVISAVNSRLQGMEVVFAESTNGYPSPPTYYYSLTGAGGPFVNSYATASPLLIGNLVTSAEYSVALFAAYTAGNTGPSNAVSGRPWIVGSPPFIETVDSSLQSLVVRFTAGMGGYPDPPTYYYSLNGASGPFVNSGTTVSPLIIGNVTTAGIYSVVIFGINDGGNTELSNAVDGRPWIVGSAPRIDAVDSSVNAVVVRFTPGAGGYPDPPTFYYSLQGVHGPFVNSGSTSSPLVIGNLSTKATYSIALLGRNSAGNTAVSNSVSGEPWVLGSPPTIDGIDSSFQRLVVRFTPGVSGNPPPSTYFYSLYGDGGPWINANTTAWPLIIGNLQTAAVYSVAMKAFNEAGNTAVSNTVWGEPWIIGAAPVVRSVSSRLQGLVIDFSGGGVGGYPEPTTYYYSLHGASGPWVDANQTTSPIVVGNLQVAEEYSVAVMAHNAPGNTQPSNAVPATPWIIGSAPVIERVDSSYQSLVVTFTPGSGGYPSPSTYYYTLTGGGSFVDANVTSSPLVVRGLTTPAVYSVRILAHNDGGNTVLSNSLPGQPWILGSVPSVTDASSVVGGLVVKFTESGSGYPVPTYWYSLDGGNTFANANVAASPITITGLNVYAVYQVTVKAVSAAGNVQANNTVTGIPYVVGSPPVITTVTSERNALRVAYTLAADRYPPDASLQYCLGSSTGVYVDASVVSHTIDGTSGNVVIAGLANNAPYTVFLRAVNRAGTTSPSNSASGTPLLVGTPPTVTDVSSILHGLQIHFVGSQGGNPPPDAYYYTLNGGNTFVLGNGVTSPLTVAGLTSPTAYNVGLIAHNGVGNTNVSNLQSATPYVVGSTPVLRLVDGDINCLVIYFDESIGGYPTPTYWYSLDGGAFENSGATSAPFTINGLVSMRPYAVRIKAVSAAGETPVSNELSGEPIVGSSLLTIVAVNSLLNGLSVVFDRRAAGVPANGTNYYYSLDGGNTFANSLQNASPVTLTGFTSPATYQVTLRTLNSAGKVVVSNTIEGSPYILRSAPTIRQITSIDNGLRIDFDESAGGFPSTTLSYLYSLDGGATFVDSSANTQSPITVRGLTTAGTRYVVLRGRSVAGATPPSNVVEGRPYVVWQAPEVVSFTTTYTSAAVEFRPSVGGYPAITHYVYSLDGWKTSANVPAGAVSATTGTIQVDLTNLSEGTTYFMAIRGVDERTVFSETAVQTVTMKSVGRFFQTTMNGATNRNRPIFVGEQPKFVKLPSASVDGTETRKERWMRIMEMIKGMR